MATIYGNSLAQVEPPLTGIHLMWSGPDAWVYSPGGWSIQRRLFQRRAKQQCEVLDTPRLQLLRQQHELRLSFGEVTLQPCTFPASLTPAKPARRSRLSSIVVPPSCELFTLELDKSQPSVRVQVSARTSFAVAFREGKAVAAQGPLNATATYNFRIPDIDAVAVYTLLPASLIFCISLPAVDEAQDWKDIPFIVKNLQLPLKDLMPELAGEEDEFAEAKSRLLPGEDLDPEEFQRLASSLRPGVQQSGPPRPLDLALLLREDPEADYEEAAALDPLRMLLSHPRWRRVLGFGYFDQDPALEPGKVYEYRISATFPAEDLADRVFGFHTIPSQTLLPADFFLGALHLRLPQPLRVDLSPQPPQAGKTHISRRGIPLQPQNEPFWQIPTLDDWSLVADFPEPVSSVILELQVGHDLRFAAGDPFDFSVNSDPLPPGERVRLDFPSPVQQLRLEGRGFLHALRLPAGPAGLKDFSVVLPPVTLVDTPRPEPPLLASLSSLQAAIPPADDDTPPAVQPLRHALGFEVRWRPAASAGLNAWPAGLGASPPLDAAVFQIEHRQDPSTDWTPVLPDENWTFGDRDDAPRDVQLFPGADLMVVFPEPAHQPPGAGLDFFWRDVFDFDVDGEEVVRPQPEPGTMHQYRVRSVDAIGRPSLAWCETGLLRLEKHVPPPVPVGPQEAASEPPAAATPSGVQARLLVRGAPDLTGDDLALLGDDDNAILLRWGWHDLQRQQDPFAREFRLYVAGPLDSVAGSLLSVTTLQSGSLAVYQVTLKLDRPVAADTAKGQNLEAGYPFHIRTHTGGALITAEVETRLPKPGGGFHVPALGLVRLPVRLAPNLTRPPAWGQRIAVAPITDAESYQFVLRNRLLLNETHPRDVLWVGVSAADDQFYVPDALSPTENRPGNESAIVPVLCQGRYHGRPVFDIPPALDPVPVFVTPEPAGQPLFFPLDLASYLAGSGLSSTDLVFPERASAGTVFASVFASDDGRVMARVLEPSQPGEGEGEIVIGNPGDRAAILAALQGADTAALEDRFAVFLAGAHPFRDRLFEPAVQAPIPFALFGETLPSNAGRYVYRVRKSDQSGRLSAGGAVAQVVVRVPDLLPGAAPERLPTQAGDAGLLRLRLPPDPALAYVLSFSQAANGGGPVDDAELLRVPNRPDLYPAGGIWLRPPGGALLSPAAKPLSDPDVAVNDDGSREVALSFSGQPGQRLRVWTCTLNRDGAPSLLGGPWSLVFPPEP